VVVLFGFISFGLVFLNEELLRLAYRSRFGELQLKKRVILVGAKEDTMRMREDVRTRRHDDLEVLAEFDLNESGIGELVKLLHETSANSVIINAKSTFFGQIEKAIQMMQAAERPLIFVGKSTSPASSFTKLTPRAFSSVTAAVRAEVAGVGNRPDRYATTRTEIW